MFLNYQNIAGNYTPNNITCSFPVGKSYTKLDPLQASKPYEEYNTKGELVGYFWRYGEALNLEFNIDGEITVESDAIIFEQPGAAPTSNTIGKLGQKAYNIFDLVSWTCRSTSKGNYSWIQDDEFTYNPDADHDVYIDANEYLKNKRVSFDIYNFRLEPVFHRVFDGTSKIIVNITPEISKTLKKGIYYCSLTVFNSDVNMKIFDTSDCTLMVK